MGTIPNTNIVGQVLTSKGDGTSDGVWASGGGGGGGITQLTGDVLAGPGSGSVAATVTGVLNFTIPFNAAQILPQFGNFTNPTVSAPVVAGETTIISPSSTALTFTLPEPAANGTTNTFICSGNWGLTPSTVYGTIVPFNPTLDKIILNGNFVPNVEVNPGQTATFVWWADYGYWFATIEESAESFYSPAVNALVGATMDPATASGSVVASTSLIFFAVYLKAGVPIRNVGVNVVATSTGTMTAAIYNSNTRLAITPSFAVSTLGTAGASFSANFYPPYTGVYYIGLALTGAAPTLSGVSLSASLLNIRSSPVTGRIHLRSSTLTGSTLPATISGSTVFTPSGSLYLVSLS